MPTPFTHRLGIETGRIQPTGYVPKEGSYVACLGSDLPGRISEFTDGDSVAFSQSADLGSSDVLRFSARTRGPAQLPKAFGIAGSTVPGLYRVTINSSTFDYVATGSQEVMQAIDALASAINASSEPVSAWIVGEADAASLFADDPSVSYSLTFSGGNAAVADFSWRASMDVDGFVFWSQTLRPGRTRDRIDGGGMVRNVRLAGPSNALRFRLEFESTIATARALSELPAFYVDNITFNPP